MYFLGFSSSHDFDLRSKADDCGLSRLMLSVEVPAVRYNSMELQRS